MDNASDEINLFLTLAFELVVLILLAIVALVGWLLLRFKVIEISDKHYFSGVLKGAAFSISGVLAFSAIVSGIIFVLNIVINFFKK